jgi:hypothetical protein
MQLGCAGRNQCDAQNEAAARAALFERAKPRSVIAQQAYDTVTDTPLRNESDTA